MSNLRDSGECEDPTARGAKASTADSAGSSSTKPAAAGDVTELKSMVYQAAISGMMTGSVIRLMKKSDEDVAFQIETMTEDQVTLKPLTLGNTVPVRTVSTSDLIDQYRVASDKVPVQFSGWHAEDGNKAWMAKTVEAEVSVITF